MAFFRYSVLWGAGLWFAVGTCVAAQSNPAGPPPPPVRLADLLERAHAANPTLRLARLQAEGAALVPRQARALPDPMVGVVGLPFPIYTARGTQRTQWRVEQGVPFPGKLRLAESIAELGADIALAEVDAHALDVELQVKQAYLELVKNQEARRLIETFRSELLRFEEIAATRYTVGSGSQQAILMAQVERSRLAVQLERLGQGRRSALERLVRLLDLEDTTSVAGEVALPELVPEMPARDLLRAALSARPEVRGLQLSQQRAGQQAALAQKGALPDFMLSATYFDIADSDMPSMADGRDAFALGLGVRVPLWRDRVRASVEQAEVERDRMEVRLEQFTLNLRSVLADLVQQSEATRRQLDLIRTTIIPQAESARESTLFAYTTGGSGFLDLLDVERTLFMLRMDEIDLLVDLNEVQARIEQAVGTAMGPSSEQH